jgi:hypothetical protein
MRNVTNLSLKETDSLDRNVHTVMWLLQMIYEVTKSMLWDMFWKSGSSLARKEFYVAMQFSNSLITFFTQVRYKPYPEIA